MQKYKQIAYKQNNSKANHSFLQHECRVDGNALREREQTIQATTHGIGSAVAIRTGYFKGTNDRVQVRKQTVAGLHVGLATAAIVCLALRLVQDDVNRLFTDSTEVMAIVVALLSIFILYQFFDGVQIILANALRGLADVKVIMWVSFITNFLIAIPSGYLLGFVCDMGIAGIWLAYPVGFVFSDLLVGRRALRLMQ